MANVFSVACVVTSAHPSDLVHRARGYSCCTDVLRTWRSKVNKPNSPLYYQPDRNTCIAASDSYELMGEVLGAAEHYCDHKPSESSLHAQIMITKRKKSNKVCAAIVKHARPGIRKLIGVFRGAIAPAEHAMQYHRLR